MKNPIKLIINLCIIAAFVLIIILLKQDAIRLQDLVLEILVSFTLFLDYRQTLDISNHDNLHEINKVLGLHPTDIEISLYFAFCTVSIALAVYVLPSSYRVFLQLLIIVLELFVINSNRKLGLKL
jgi:Na+-transporting NADH:ubiquinone oxidoreductase subunit NqrD